MDNSREKSPKKKRGNIANLVPGAGRGCKPGAANAGRPPDWWKAEMREQRDRYLIAAKTAGIVDDPSHPLWQTLGKFFHEAIDGRASQNVNLTATVTIADAIAAARERATKR